MASWMYTTVTFVVNEKSVRVRCSQVGQELLSRNVPTDSKVSSGIQGFYEISVKNLPEAIALEERILTLLGFQGWEAYAHEGANYYMKRLVV